MLRTMYRRLKREFKKYFKHILHCAIISIAAKYGCIKNAHGEPGQTPGPKNGRGVSDKRIRFSCASPKRLYSDDNQRIIHTFSRNILIKSTQSFECLKLGIIALDISYLGPDDLISEFTPKHVLVNMQTERGNFFGSAIKSIDDFTSIEDAEYAAITTAIEMLVTNAQTRKDEDLQKKNEACASNVESLNQINIDYKNRYEQENTARKVLDQHVKNVKQLLIFSWGLFIIFIILASIRKFMKHSNQTIKESQHAQTNA